MEKPRKIPSTRLIRLTLYIIAGILFSIFSHPGLTADTTGRAAGAKVELSPQTAPLANPLPNPTHPLYFGYYHPDGRYGDYWQEVNCYTNLYLGGRHNYFLDDPLWDTKLRNHLQQARNDGKKIYLSLDMNGARDSNPNDDVPQIDATLEAARPNWDLVVCIELADEPDWRPAGQINARINLVNARLAAKGLPRRPLGVVYSMPQLAEVPDPPNRITNSALEWIGIEAYVDPPEMGPTSCDTIAVLNQKVNRAKSKIPGKDIAIVMQSYDRNGCWTDMSQLLDLQTATYLLGYNDPRVFAITMFSYGREGTGCSCPVPYCGGAHFRQELIAAHKAIGERVLGLSGPPSCGAPSQPISLPSCNAPVLISPLGNTTQAAPTFTWTSVAGATSYWLLVTDSPDFSNPGTNILISVTVTGTSYPSPISFQPGNPYYWRVKSLFSGSPGEWSTTGSFTVVLPGSAGTTTPGIFRNGTWLLRNSNTTGLHDLSFGFGGMAGDIPVAGDWNHDGVDTVGVFRNGAWLLRNSNTAGEPDLTFFFGRVSGDTPVVGDWNGDGIDTVGIFRNGTWFLRNSNTTGIHDIAFNFGIAGDIPIVGDWDGDGIDTIGVYRNGIWLLRNSNAAGTPGLILSFGANGDIPVAGDWNGDGIDTIGIFRRGLWFLRNSNTSGDFDLSFVYGSSSDNNPVVGDWDGN